MARDETLFDSLIKFDGWQMYWASMPMRRRLRRRVRRRRRALIKAQMRYEREDSTS